MDETEQLEQKIKDLEAEIKQLTNGEECHGICFEDTDKSYFVPEGVMQYMEQVNINWQKDRDRIKKLEKALIEAGTATGQYIKDFTDEHIRLIRENVHLKEILFCCGEVAVSEWEDLIVGLVDSTLNGFKIPKERYIEILTGIKPKKENDHDHEA